MRDELDLLLGEEQEEEDVPLHLLTVRSGGRVPAQKNGRQEGGEETPLRDGRTVAGDEAEAAGTQEGLSGTEEKVFGQLRYGSQEAVPGLYRRDGGAESLYRTLTRMRWASGYQRPAERERTPLVRRTERGGDESRDVRWLDRAFQRDARRYDGGFTWQ